MKRFVIPTAILVAVCLTPVPRALADEQRTLSGTVLTGSALWPEEAACEKAADCVAWLRSGCNPALAGHDPALMASIEDVTVLAKAGTVAEFRYESGVPDGLPWVVPQWNGAVIQFWDAACAEIPGSGWSATHCYRVDGSDCASPALRIPDSARWMTVAGTYAGNPPTAWTLTPLPTRHAQYQPAPAPSESPSAQPSPGGESTMVERSVDLALRGHLRAQGAVKSEDPTCLRAVDVVIQRESSVDWIEVDSTTTDAAGAFALRLRDRSGHYRAVVSEVRSSDHVCVETISETQRHRH